MSNIVTYDSPLLKSHLGKHSRFYLQHCGLMCLVSVINAEDGFPPVRNYRRVSRTLCISGHLNPLTDIVTQRSAKGFTIFGSS